MSNDLGWIHLFERGSNQKTLLLLHGTGGDEASLIDIAKEIDPDSNYLGVRGRSLEEGSPRFFRRFTATRYDQAHLKSEAEALAKFVSDAAKLYEFDQERITALGYSNGANIALASLVESPSIFSGAILFRPVMALENPPVVNLKEIPIFLSFGLRDPYLAFGESIPGYLSQCNARVEEHKLTAGHELTDQDINLAKAWANI